MSLPLKLLRQIFRDALRVYGEIDPWYHCPLQSSGLFLLDKYTSAEASRIFYGENCFDLRVFKSAQAATFIRKIGSNAGKIKQVHIDINVCPTTGQLDEDSRITTELLRKSCCNLKTIIVSLQIPDGLDADEASRLRLAIRDHYDKNIEIHHASNNNTQSAIVQTEHAKVKNAFLNRYLDAEENGQCCKEPNGTCDKHPHILCWITRAWFDIISLRRIHLMLLRDAQEVGEARIPDHCKTIISANGKLRHVEWKNFRMRVFHRPRPTNALQATLAMVLHAMSCYTAAKSVSLGYGKFAPDCRQVYSRRDIRATFPAARELSFTDMCQKILSIRILDFIEERTEHTEDEEKMFEKERERERERRKAGRIREQEHFVSLGLGRNAGGKSSD